MDSTIIELLTQVGGPSAVAIFAIWVLNRVWSERVTEAQRYASRAEEREERLVVLMTRTLDVLDRNTETWVKLMNRVEN